MGNGIGNLSHLRSPFHKKGVLFHDFFCTLLGFSANGSGKEHQLSVTEGCFDHCLHRRKIAVL